MATRALRKTFPDPRPVEAPVQLSLAVAPAGSPPPAGPPAPVIQAGSATAPPQLWLGVHLPQPDPALLQRLGVLAQRFTPRVSLEPPDGLVLEVLGSLALFGGVARLYRAFRAGCQAAGAAPVLTLAPTPLAALVAGRSGVSFKVLEQQLLVSAVSPLPLSALRWPPQVLQRLSKLGVYRIGQALRLPRAGFARRFGQDCLRMLDQLVARDPDLRSLFTVPERFRAKREFVREREDHAQILQALQPLLGQLGGISRGTPVRHHPHHLPAAAPQRAADRLRGAAGAARGGRGALPGMVCRTSGQDRAARPGALAGAALRRTACHGRRCMHPCGGRENMAAAVRRACCPVPRNSSNGCACAWASPRCRASPARTAIVRRAPHGRCRRWRPGLQRGAGVRQLTAQPARPLWLLADTAAAAGTGGWPQLAGPLRLGQGPERIESQWWDAQGIARDYYHATDGNGIAVWVFRERHPPHRWFLHGLAG